MVNKLHSTNFILQLTCYADTSRKTYVLRVAGKLFRNLELAW